MKSKSYKKYSLTIPQPGAVVKGDLKIVRKAGGGSSWEGAGRAGTGGVGRLLCNLPYDVAQHLFRQRQMPSLFINHHHLPGQRRIFNLKIVGFHLEGAEAKADFGDQGDPESGGGQAVSGFNVFYLVDHMGGDIVLVEDSPQELADALMFRQRDELFVGQFFYVLWLQRPDTCGNDSGKNFLYRVVGGKDQKQAFLFDDLAVKTGRDLRGGVESEVQNSVFDMFDHSFVAALGKIDGDVGVEFSEALEYIGDDVGTVGGAPVRRPDDPV